jgi:D-cysteine desulfhydrase family pyridoxal phosphate-dependent enzyme
MMGPALNGVRLYVKRDDLLGLGGGGNKLRKLEYLMGDAAANGCDTIIVSGGIQSNFTRVTAAACARQKVGCELVLAPLVPDTDDDYQCNGNTILNDLFGAKRHLLGRGETAADFARRRAEDLAGQGRRPYLTPGGGSNSISALGYVRCALELDTQLNSTGLDDAIIVMANGSNGTHAGLLAGFKALGRSPRQLRAFTVLANMESSRSSTLAMANGTLELLGESDRLEIDDVQIADDQRGRGYGLVTDAMIEAVRLMASCEGLLLDPVYSGKAFAGVIGDVRSGRYPAGSSVVFLMTGGTPALFAYRSAFARKGART